MEYISGFLVYCVDVFDAFIEESKYDTFITFKFQLVNEEMFWVVTEVCSEPNPVKRMKIIKQFIKIARKYFLFIYITISRWQILTMKSYFWELL